MTWTLWKRPCQISCRCSTVSMCLLCLHDCILVAWGTLEGMLHIPLHHFRRRGGPLWFILHGFANFSSSGIYHVYFKVPPCVGDLHVYQCLRNAANSECGLHTSSIGFPWELFRNAAIKHLSQEGRTSAPIC